MKKVLAICLSALLILVSLPVSMALAENDAKIYATADKTTVCPGSTVAISVVMENNPGVILWKVSMDYDAVFSTAKELVVKGDIFPGVFPGPTAKSPFNMTWSDALAESDNTENGVMYTVTFNVAADAAEGDYVFSLACDPEDCYNVNWDEIAFATAGVTVTVGHTFANDCDTTCDCGATREVEGHKYDSACDADCNKCGETREAADHKYDSVCDTDCNECGAVRVVEGHEYTYACDKVCNKCYELTNPDADHTIVAVDAKASTCYEDGNVAYWYCSDCGTAWLDAALTQMTNLKSIVVPMAHQEATHVAAKAPTCYEDGNIEYWYCEACGQAWLNEECTLNTNLKAVILPMAHQEATHVAAKAPTCYEDGNIEYWYCEACGQAWLNEECTLNTNLKAVILPMAHQEATHVAAKAPTCYEAGNIEYWYCEACGQAWLDEACTLNTNLKAVVLPAAHENLVHVEAVEAGCHYIGNIEHWVCYACETWYADEALTQITNSKNVIIPAKESTATKVEAKTPTCTENGNVAYWTCDECEQVWADEALTQLTNIKNVQIAPSCSYNAVHNEGVAAGCHYTGRLENWYCATCDVYYLDADCTQITNYKSLTIPALESTATKVEAKDPTCTENGNVAYWTCDKCEQVWADEALTQLTNIKNVQIAPVHTGVQHKEAIAPGCHYNGNIEYWVCYDCETWFADEALTQITNSKNVIVPALESTATKVEAKTPTCTENGNVAYWTCDKCEQVWADEALTQLTNIKNVQIAPSCSYNAVHNEGVAAGCHYTGRLENWYCATCDVYYLDADCTQITNYKSLTIPALESTATKVEAKAPTCYENGNVEYWTCDKCEQVWADEALTQLTNIKNVQIAPAHTNLVHVDAVAAGCHYIGNIEHWVCYACETWYADEALTQITNSKNVIIPALESTATKVEAKTPTCTENGNVAYWTCDKCEQVWADEALTQLTNIKNVQIAPSCSYNAVHNEGVAAGCHYTGRLENWYCATCDVYYLDADCTQITNYKSLTIPALESTATKVEAKAPTCYENGNVEYWTCDKCEQVWADEALTQLTNIKNVQIAPAHTNLVHVDAVAAGCHYIGNIEHWVCYACETWYADEALTQITNSKNVIIPALESTATKVEAKDPTCTENGNVAYWTCDKCEQVWADEALTQLTNIKNVQIAPSCSYNAVHNEGIEAGCHMTGRLENWYCATCDVYYLDADCTQITNYKSLTVPAKGGDLVHVEAKTPTATENGNIEHWYCEKCEQVWADEALTQLTNHKNVIIPALGEDTTTTTKPEGEGNQPSKPMGENALPIIVCGLIALIAAAGAVLFSKKKA